MLPASHADTRTHTHTPGTNDFICVSEQRWKAEMCLESLSIDPEPPSSPFLLNVVQLDQAGLCYFNPPSPLSLPSTFFFPVSPTVL